LPALTHPAARGSAFLVDIGVVLTLCLRLPLRRSSTWGVAAPIITVLLHRGALLAAMQAAELIADAAQPASVAALSLHLVGSRVYCASFLATLSAREFVRTGGSARGSRGTRSGTADDADEYTEARTSRAPAFTSVFDVPQFSTLGDDARADEGACERADARAVRFMYAPDDAPLALAAPKLEQPEEV
jgi:hypothetical protein